MNKVKNEYTFSRLLFTEIKHNLTFGKLMGLMLGGLVMPILVNYLPLIIGGFGSSLPHNISLLLMATGAVSIFIFSRIVMAVQAKATVDKNKAAFIYYGKNKVTLAKLIVEAIMFSAGFFMLFAIADVIGEAKGGGIKYGDFIKNMFLVFPGYLTLYLLIYTLGKWIISFIPKKGLAIAVAMFMTLVILLPIWILNQIPDTTTLAFSVNRGGADLSTNWLAKNQKVIAFIPFINTGLSGGLGLEFNAKINIHGKDVQVPVKQLEDTWTGIIPIFTNIAIIGAVWNLQSSAQKRYLAAS